jgi:hypothetical protein
MNRAHRLAIVVVCLCGVSPNFAGDLDELPKDNAGFKEKIAAFIKPGSSTADARRLLEMHRFQCQDSKDTSGPYVWCDRSDGGSMALVKQRYQVILRMDGRALIEVKTSTGLFGP